MTDRAVGTGPGPGVIAGREPPTSLRTDGGHAGDAQVHSDGQPRVAVVGDGPAAVAAREALADADVAVVSDDVSSLETARLGVVVGVAGADGFAVANRHAQAGDTPWLAVSAGGIAGYEFDDVAAAVAGFVPGGGCLHCLDLRLAASGAGAGAEGGAGAGTGTGDAAADGQEANGGAGALRDGGDPVPTTRADQRLAGAIAGREAVRTLAGEPFADVVELPHRRRSFVAVPGCPVCGTGRDRSLPWNGVGDAAGEPADAAADGDAGAGDGTDTTLDLQTVAAMAERAVDDRTGVVQVVGERESYPAPYYLAMLASTDGFSDASAMGKAAGVDQDWDAAYVKAVGEGLERYAAGVYRADEFTEAPAAALDDAVPPSAFVRPDDAPAPDPDRTEQWVPGVALADGDSASLPAELVHFPPPSETHRPAITTGLGLHTSLDGALAAGALEVLERDASMLAWYSSCSPLALTVDDERFDALARRARSESLSVAVSLLTQDVDVPVVAAAVHREEWPRFAAGTAAGFDATAAATDALAEAVQNWMELRALGPDDADDAGAAVARYADDPDGAAELLGDGTGGGGAVQAASVGPASPPASRRAVVENAVERAATAGVDLYAARLTTPDLAALGFEAVRVLSPQAQPLFVDRPYFGERARTVPPELGFAPRLDRAYHPFP